MTRLSFAIVAIVALTLMAVPSVFAEYCVIRDSLGQMGITNGSAAYGWSEVSPASCFATIDQAQRDAGTGTGFNFRPYAGSPRAVAKSHSHSFMVEGLP
jgi:hypothetical protein